MKNLFFGMTVCEVTFIKGIMKILVSISTLILLFSSLSYAQVNAYCWRTKQFQEYSRVTPLMVAETPEEVRELLKNGAEINAVDKNGCNALHHALGLSDGPGGFDFNSLLFPFCPIRLEVFEELVKNGADLNHQCTANSYLKIHSSQTGTPTKKSYSPFHLLMRNSSYITSEYFFKVVESILDKADIHQRDNDGWTPLMTAAMSLHPRLLQMLIEHGARVSDKNDLGIKALHVALHTEPPGPDSNIRNLNGEWNEIFKKRWIEGIQILSRDYTEEYAVTDIFYLSPVEYWNHSVYDSLSHYSENFQNKAIDLYQPNTSLLSFVQFDWQYRLISKLVPRTNSLAIELALLRASSQCQLNRLVEDLIKTDGADPNGPESGWRTSGFSHILSRRPLRLALKYECDQNVSILLETGANPNAIEDWSTGNIPIFWDIAFQFREKSDKGLEYLNWMLNHGANASAKCDLCVLDSEITPTAFTYPVHAFINTDVELLETLGAHGADFSALDHRGYTALSESYRLDLDHLKVFKKHGGDINHPSYDGNTELGSRLKADKLKPSELSAMLATGANPDQMIISVDYLINPDGSRKTLREEKISLKEYIQAHSRESLKYDLLSEFEK